MQRSNRELIFYPARTHGLFCPTRFQSVSKILRALIMACNTPAASATVKSADSFPGSRAVGQLHDACRIFTGVGSAPNLFFVTHGKGSIQRGKALAELICQYLHQTFKHCGIVIQRIVLRCVRTAAPLLEPASAHILPRMLIFF